jgi:hypothetical protein
VMPCACAYPSGAGVADTGAAHHLQRHDRLEADPQTLLLRHAVGVLSPASRACAWRRHNRPTAASRSGPRRSSRRARGCRARAAGSARPAANRARPSRRSPRSLLKSGPADLVEATHRRLRAGVEHQDVGADFGDDALGGAWSVTSARIVATPSRSCTEARASASRATTVTRAPWATRASTSPRPRPRLPPVTITFMSLRLIVSAPWWW